jgi:hypothetical protein
MLKAVLSTIITKENSVKVASKATCTRIARALTMVCNMQNHLVMDSVDRQDL